MSEHNQQLRAASTHRSRWIDGTVLALLLMLAGWVRFTHVDAEPSFDELWHLRLAAGRGLPLQAFPADQVITNPVRVTSLDDAPNLWAVWTRMDGVLHPPLYVSTLRLWREAFGESERAAHAYSIVLSLAGLCFVYAAARLAMDRVVATLIVLGVACSQTQVYYAQEIRGYALMILWASMAVWIMTRIELLGPTRRRLIALSALSFLLLLTHYFAAGAVLAIAIYGWLRAGPWRRTFVASLAIAAVTYAIVWLPFAVRQLDHLGSGDIFLKATTPSVWTSLLLLAGTPFRLIADRYYIPGGVTTLASRADLLLPLTGLLFVLPWLLLRRLPVLLPWGLWLSCSLSVLFVLDVARSTMHLSLVRYLAVASPVVPLLFIGCAQVVHRTLAIVLAIALVVAGATYCFTGHRGVGESAEHSGFVRYLERSIAPEEAIVTHRGSDQAYYGDLLMVFVAHSERLFPRPILVLTSAMTPAQRSMLPRRIWLVTGAPDRPVGDIVPGAVVLRYKVIERDEHVYYLELPETDSGSTRPAS